MKYLLLSLFLGVPLLLVIFFAYQRATQPTAPTEVPSFGLPPADSATMPCGYVWAQQDLPEIGLRFNADLQKLIPAATGGAYAFGEDCVREDGSRTFGAMETDFTIDIPVQDLKDDAALGAYLEQLIPFLAAYPTESLPARLNRIDLRFFVSEQEFRYVRFELGAGVAAYEQGLRGAALLRELDKKE
ncbi:MAG: hypothetical protein HY869_07365 [Chloroflexi bacterium]|nr:hypothetical protein [Chloroflexota bacterium]